jgi:GTP:adenosylcobinamide-phosphate guanylyltransferase
MSGVTAVVMAGSRPGGDPFAQAHETDLKPLIPVAGEPMVRRPVTALLASEGLIRVLVLSQQPERIGAVLPADPRLTVTRSGDTIAATVLSLIDDPATEWPLLVTTADHALLTTQMIEELVAKGSGADLSIGIVERAPLLKRLPQSKRTWIPFRGAAYTGANLFLLGSRKVRPAIELWRSVEQDRKKGWRMLAAFGPAILLGAVLRLRTLEQTLAVLGRKLSLSIRAVELSDPLAAVDVDKEEDLQLVESILAGQA